MILVLTDRGDYTADLVVNAIGDRADIARIDPSDIPTTATLAASGPPWVGTITDTDRTVDLAQVRAVYYRRPGKRALPERMSPGERAWATQEARYGVDGLLASLDAGCWMNHPHHNRAAEYKPRQLAVAATVGLATPRTLITNDPAAAKQFIAESHDVVYKPLSGSPTELPAWSIYTRPVTADMDLEGVAHTAHLFQQQIRKAYEVRLTVVGEHLFPARIDAHSPAARIDWRSDYDNLTYRTVDVPVTAAEAIHRLMQILGLRFGALDFIVDHDGAWWFLEINPNGQWGWIEHHTGLPIARAIADNLIEGDHHADR